MKYKAIYRYCFYCGEKMKFTLLMKLIEYCSLSCQIKHSEEMKSRLTLKRTLTRIEREKEMKKLKNDNR